MVWAKLVYLAIVAGLAVFYVLYIDSLPLILLICALVVPILLRIGLTILHFSADASILCEATTCTTEDPVPMTVQFRNRSRLFFPRGEAKVRVSHAFGKGDEVIRIKFPVQDRNHTRLTFFVDAGCCGLVTAELVQLRVYDVFRLFHTNIRRETQAVSLLVLPKPILLSLDESAPPVEDPESIRFADKPGDDPSELFGIREYQPGDPVSRIHWKLSSHSDKLFLKEFAAPVEKHALLLAEFRPPEDAAELKIADQLLTLLYSIAMQLINAEHPVTIAWYDLAKEQVTECSPKDDAALADCFRKLYDSMYTLGSTSQALQDALGSRHFSSATVITNVPDTEMLGILEHSMMANHRSLLILTDETVPLHSDETEICTVSPAKLAVSRLIV